MNQGFNKLTALPPQTKFTLSPHEGALKIPVPLWMATEMCWSR